MRILMLGSPPDLNTQVVLKAMRSVVGVENVQIVGYASAKN